MSEGKGKKERRGEGERGERKRTGNLMWMD